jgi:hypothetical protein
VVTYWRKTKWLKRIKRESGRNTRRKLRSVGVNLPRRDCRGPMVATKTTRNHTEDKENDTSILYDS